MPRTRSEAVAQGAKYYFTGVPCKHGHIALRKTKGACLLCLQEEWKKALVTRSDYYAAYNQSPAGQAAKARYYAQNKSAIADRAKKTPAEAKKKYREAWASAHPEQVKALTRSRRRKHRNATPAWLTQDEVKQTREVYVSAMTKTRETGVPHVVDHIVPLQGELVCGLHVPWNLRVLTREENAAKGNKMPAEEDLLAGTENA